MKLSLVIRSEPTDKLAEFYRPVEAGQTYIGTTAFVSLVEFARTNVEILYGSRSPSPSDPPGVAGGKSKESWTIASEPVKTRTFAPQFSTENAKYHVLYIVPVPSVRVAETVT